MKIGFPHIHHLRYKLLIFYWLLSLFILTAFSLFVYFSIKESVEKNIDDSLSMQVELIKNSIETSYEASIKAFYRATAYASLDVVNTCYSKFLNQEMTEREARDLAWSLLKGTGLGPSGYVTVLNSQGIMIYHPFPEYAGADLSETRLTQSVIAGNEAFIEYDWVNPGDETPREKLLYSIYFEPWDWYLSVTGYRDELTELVTLSDFEDKILSIRFGETGYPIVVDMEGTLLIHPEYKGINMYDRQDSMGDVVRQSIREKNGRMEYLWKNPGDTSYRKKLTIFAEIPQFRIILAATSYKSEIMKPLTNLRRIFLIAAVMSLLFTSIMTILISRTITSPIVELKKKMNAAAQGDLSIRSEIVSTDEVGEIGLHFNNLISALQRNHEELENTQKKLIREERFSNMGRLLARISHHLNTPIGNAMMTGSYLDEELNKCQGLIKEKVSHDEELESHQQNVRDAYELMQRSINRSVDIIKNFKLLQLDAGERSPVRAVMKEFLEVHFRSPWKNRFPDSVKIHINCDGNISLKTDFSLLQLVLDKLAENSLIHGFRNKPGGLVQVDVSSVPGGIRLVFSDDGDGIPAEMADRVFEPFFSQTGNFNNTGLGLNIIYNVLTMTLEGTILYVGDRSGCRYSIFLPDLE